MCVLVIKKYICYLKEKYSRVACKVWLISLFSLAVVVNHPHISSVSAVTHNDSLQLNHHIVLLQFFPQCLFYLSSSSLHCINSHLICIENVPEMQNLGFIHVGQITSST